VFDLEQRQPIAFLPLVKGPDLVKFDSELKSIYVPATAEQSPGSRTMIRIISVSWRSFQVQKKVHSFAVGKDTHGVNARRNRVDGVGGSKSTPATNLKSLNPKR
jgi:hypothetical protein